MTDAAPGVATALAPVIARLADASVLPVMVDMPTALPPVTIPAASIETVLAMLFENSRHAGAKTVTVRALQEDAIVRLRVADDGPGVAPADAARLFEPFFTTRRATGGTGLGLTIAKSLLAAAGADILFVPGDRGAVFDLHLPSVGSA